MANDNAGQKYWFDGLPFSGVAPTGGHESGTQNYWFDGLPLVPFVVEGEEAAFQELSPDCITDTDVIYAPEVSSLQQTLQPALVTDADSIYAPAIANTSQFLQPPLHTDVDDIRASQIGDVVVVDVLAPSLHTDIDSYFIHALSGSKGLLLVLWNDTDIFYLPNVELQKIQKKKQELLPGTRVLDDDTIYPATFRTGLLAPQLHTDSDAVYAPVFTVGPVSLVPQRITDTDVFYAPSVARTLRPNLVTDIDVITTTTVDARAVARPALVTDADEFYIPLFSHIVQPVFTVDVDDIPVADVGWQVIAEFTNDALTDQAYACEVTSWFYILPDAHIEEDIIETYPFFIQAISGGTPVPKPSEVLTGTVGHKALTGTVGHGVLTGKIDGGLRPQLTGTIGRRKAA